MYTTGTCPRQDSDPANNGGNGGKDDGNNDNDKERERSSRKGDRNARGPLEESNGNGGGVGNGEVVGR